MTARLVYKRAQKGSDLSVAQIAIRVCPDWNKEYNLVATVIENRNGTRKTHEIVNTSPKLLALAVADYVNEILQEGDMVWCSSELPEHTRQIAGCEATFKDYFCGDVDAITDSERNMQRVDQDNKERSERVYGDWRRWRTDQAKALIFGGKNDG